MYHRIDVLQTDPWELAVTPAHFEQHLQILQKQKCVISLPELIKQWQNRNLSNNAVVLTFDDGYADNFYFAKPLLEKYGIPACFFLTTTNIVLQKEFWWDELDRIFLQSPSLPGHLSIMINDHSIDFDLGDEAVLSNDLLHKHSAWTADQPPPTKRCMLYYEIWKNLKFISHETQQRILSGLREWAGTKDKSNFNRCITIDELKRFSKNDLFHFGAHTQNHQALASLNFEQQKNEIAGSQHFIKQLLQKEITAFAYPYGNFNHNSIEILKQLQFKIAVTTNEATVSQKIGKFCFGRFQVKNINGFEFEKKLARWKRY